MMADTTELALLGLALILDDDLDELIAAGKRKRRKREWIKRREDQGVFCNLLRELAAEDPASYRNWLRMDSKTFDQLAALLTPRLQKSVTNFQRPLSVKERLAILLRFLATGSSFRDVAFQFRVGERTVSYVVMETCEAVSEILGYTFNFPKTSDAWKLVSKGYSDRWNFPHCLGAVDGKHVVMQKPQDAGSHFYNYKGTNSVVLMALVDADLNFRYIDVGTNGRVSDRGVWSKCSLSKLLEENKLQVPDATLLPGIPDALPYVFIGDDAFPLKRYFLKPYSGTNLTQDQRIFNYRLSRARRCVESAFGILASRFRVFLRPMTVAPDKVKKITFAACALHNYLRATDRAVYSPASLIDHENLDTGEVALGEWRKDVNSSSFAQLRPTTARHASSEAKNIRDMFCKYFVSTEGSVHWQWNR